MSQQQKTRYSLETYVVLLNAIIAADFLFNCNEFLKNTTAYKHRLKQAINLLGPELEKIINEDFGLLMGTDENARVLFNLQDGVKKLVDQLQMEKYIKHKPAHLAGLGKLLEQFHMMPENVLHRNGIRILEE